MNPLALGRVRRLCNELGVLLHQQYPIVEEYYTGRGKKRQAAGYRLHCIGGACGACASWIGPRPALPPLVSVFLLHLHACASTEAQHMHVRCVRPHPPRFRSSDGRMGKKKGLAFSCHRDPGAGWSCACMLPFAGTARTGAAMPMHGEARIDRWWSSAVSVQVHGPSTFDDHGARSNWRWAGSHGVASLARRDRIAWSSKCR
jgi:hypothetical protein